MDFFLGVGGGGVGGFSICHRHNNIFSGWPSWPLSHEPCYLIVKLIIIIIIICSNFNSLLIIIGSFDLKLNSLKNFSPAAGFRPISKLEPPPPFFAGCATADQELL